MKTGKWSIQKLIYTAMLAAVAGVLMSLEFSVPMMPPFYKVDFSDVPSVIAVFLMGPVSGICVEVIKLLIKLITVGTNTMYVGELANLIAAFLFVWPLWFLYQKLGANRKAAVEALLLSIVIRTACACFINANITLPLYAKAMSLSLDPHGSVGQPGDQRPEWIYHPGDDPIQRIESGTQLYRWTAFVCTPACGEDCAESSIK